MTDTLLLGAVAYDPKVVTIWDGFKAWFEGNGLAFDYILYSNYERQVESHFAGHYHVAWNSPLAWLQTQRIAHRLGREVRTVAMRDSDRDLRSVVVARKGSGIESVDDLRGKTLGVGAEDSPQATLIPLIHLADAGLEPEKDFSVRCFDVLVGKHGDHVGGERDAMLALIAGEVDAACVIEGNLAAFTTDGTISVDDAQVVTTTAEFDHCNFTVLDAPPENLISRFCELLLSMRYDDPEVRPLLELEGLRAWKPGRTDGYALLDRAVDRFGTIDGFVADLTARTR